MPARLFGPAGIACESADADFGSLALETPIRFLSKRSMG
jgi:hypothetical protein